MGQEKGTRRPPMGWNSYDYYDSGVTEKDVRANAQVMARELKKYGWEYVVVDAQWAAANPGAMRESFQYVPFGHFSMDEYSRLIPDPERFPSSIGGAGFKPLTDYIHSLGLKFGIHIMRGIPRCAAHAGMAIFGSEARADEVADPLSTCRWNPDMYGVRDTAAGQAYYDSIVAQYAGWGVDFIKCDDICNTDNWVEGSDRAFERSFEIVMLHKAIEKTGRDMVLSLSPGPALVDKADFYAKYAHMWRITDDMWDRWDHVKNMFRRCRLWQGKSRPGAYPDCDMLPLGTIGKGFLDERQTRLNKDEQRTVMTLWCIFGSPLMLGAELTKLDDWTVSLITNEEGLGLLDPANKRRETSFTAESSVWELITPEGAAYRAVFNLGDVPAALDAELADKTDVWTGERTANTVPPHGCALLRL